MTWLEARVRMASLKQFGLALLALVAMAAGLMATSGYLANYFSGPYDIPHTQLAAAKSIDDFQRYWVKVTPEKMLDTHIDHITVNKRRGIETSRGVTGHYWAGVVANKLLIIKTAAQRDSAEATFIGKLVALPEDLKGKVTGNASTPEARNAILPVMLELERFESQAEIELAGALAVLAAALIGGLIALRRYASPANHPALVALVKGSGTTLKIASSSIEDDIKAGQFVALKSYKLTPHHLVKTGGLTFKVMPLSDLLWAYQLTTTKKLWGVIPTSKSYSNVLNFKDAAIDIKSGKDKSEDVLRYLAYVAPWTYIGYQPELAAAYKSKRKELAAHVADRHSASMQAAKPA